MSNGILGGLFDFNNDGNLDAFEQGAEFGFLQQMMDEEEKEDNDYDSDDEY